LNSDNDGVGNFTVYDDIVHFKFLDIAEGLIFSSKTLMVFGKEYSSQMLPTLYWCGPLLTPRYSSCITKQIAT
jgi:hypothetical protein